MDHGKALIYKSYGLPKEVVELESRTETSPGSGEVKIRMLAAPIHPSDFGMILGKYGRLAELPAVAGREGIAEIAELGEDTGSLEIGDRVTVPSGTGSWQETAVVRAADLFNIPKDIPVEMAAMVMINPPTAWRLLRDVEMSEGDWVIQNAANSAVGLHVIEMAHYLGLKTLNVVRREELIEPLMKLGADTVVLEESGYEKQVKEITGGKTVRLALNSIGGESAMRLIKSLSPGGLHVTFGAMQFETVRFPTRALIFDDITIKGFWMDKWIRDQSKARIQIMFDKIFDLMRKGIVNPSVAETYSLDDYKEALEGSLKPRLGKVLFRMDSGS